MLIFLGLLSLGIGTLGVILPVLPTTPFVLISAYCFVRSSEKLHTWLMNHHRFGPIVRRFQEGKGISLRVKLGSLGAAYLMVGTAIVLLDNLHVRIFLVVLLITKTVFMARIPTYRPTDEGEDELGERVRRL